MLLFITICLVLEKCAADEPPTEEPTRKKSGRKSSTSTTDEQTGENKNQFVLIIGNI